MRGEGRRLRKGRDLECASRPACAQPHLLLTSPNRKSLGRSSTPSSDGSTPRLKTNLLASRIFSRPLRDQTFRKKQHRPQATTLAVGITLATVQDGHRRELNRRLPLTRATPALFRTRTRLCLLPQTPEAHLMDHMARSALAWLARRIAVAGDGT